MNDNATERPVTDTVILLIPCLQIILPCNMNKLPTLQAIFNTRHYMLSSRPSPLRNS